MAAGAGPEPFVEGIRRRALRSRRREAPSIIGLRACWRASRTPCYAPRRPRAVEDDPGGEVLGEVLEAVLDPGGDEEHVAGRERDALAAHEERPAPARDDVELVPVVGRLAVSASGRVVAELHAAVLHDE